MFLSTNEENAKGQQILENLVFSITGEALSRYNNNNREFALSQKTVSGMKDCLKRV